MSSVEDIRRKVENSLNTHENMPAGSDELEKIFLSLNTGNFISKELFQGKYKVFLLKNVLPWRILPREPLLSISNNFETVFVIFGAKMKKHPTAVSKGGKGIANVEVWKSESDSPISPVFESLSFEEMKLILEDCKKYALCSLSPTEVNNLLHICVSIDHKKRLEYPVVIFGKEPTCKTTFIKGCYTTSSGKQLRLDVNNPGTVLESFYAPKYLKELELHRNKLHPKIPVSSNVFVHFHVPYDKNLKSPPSKKMKVDVECYWNNVGKLLEPPAVEATFFMNMQCVEGDVDTGAFLKFHELKILHALNNSLVDGVMHWSPTYGRRVLHGLEFLINDVKEPFRSKYLKRKPMKTSFDYFEEVVIDERRKDLDLCEKLWIILKDCSSTEVLVEGLTYVYKRLKEFIEPPFVHSKSSSKLSTDIKSIREKNIKTPVLDFKTALHMLLEIGTEKVRRDYYTLFCCFELAPVESFNYYQEESLVSAQSVLLLRMLHVVLEMTFICLKALNFPKRPLCDFVRNCLKHYTSVSRIDFQHIFRVQVPSDVAFHMLAKLHPTTWEVSLLSSKGKMKKQTILRFSKIPSPQHIYAKKYRDDSESYGDFAYVFLRSTLVEDDFF